MKYCCNEIVACLTDPSTAARWNCSANWSCTAREEAATGTTGQFIVVASDVVCTIFLSIYCNAYGIRIMFLSRSRQWAYFVKWRQVTLDGVDILLHKGKGKGKETYSSLQAGLRSPLRELTYHMGSHSVICHPAEVTFPPLPQPKLVLDLATLEGCKAELTEVVG